MSDKEKPSPPPAETRVVLNDHLSINSQQPVASNTATPPPPKPKR